MKIWAIVNITPDSFYRESRTGSEDLIARCKKFLSEGADKLDIGAESTRPLSTPITHTEEWKRLELPLRNLKELLGPELFFKTVSIDTYKVETARKVLEMGVGTINDITGGAAPGMFDEVSRFGASIVIMHSVKTPMTMQESPAYTNVVKEVHDFLMERTNAALGAGIHSDNIIWDYGIGFGKTTDHNLELLANTDHFRKSGYRLMAGVSRKSFIGNILQLATPEERRDPTLVVHSWLCATGIDILRVHDVADTAMMRELIGHIQSAPKFQVR